MNNNEMMARSMRALMLEMSRDIGGKLNVEIGWPPSWYPATNTIKLPFFINADTLDQDDLHHSRSFAGHESGEKEYNALDPDDPRWSNKQVLKAFVNIVGDARINLKREYDYPGFKRSHAHTVQVFKDKFIQKAETVDHTKLGEAQILAMCAAEFIWENYETYESVMEWPVDSAVKRHLTKIKPFLSDNVKAMTCEDVAQRAIEMYHTLGCTDITEEQAEETVKAVFGIPNKDGTCVAMGNLGRDYAVVMAEQFSKSNLDNLPISPTKRHTVYTFNPEVDQWVNYPSAKMPQIGFHDTIDLDRLALVLSNKLIKILQVPGNIPQRYQTSGRLDTARIADVLNYRLDVFKKKYIDEVLDVAVSLSIDCSSSMNSISQDVRAGAATWLKALGLAGISTEVLGWYQTSGGSLYSHSNITPYRTGPITWQVIKDFSEHWNIGTFRIMEKMRFAGGTPSGEGISIPGFRLSARPEARKILIVATDGSPQLACSGVSEIHHNYIRDSIDAFRKRGIEVYGLALHDWCYDAVTKMFGEDNSLKINHIGVLLTKDGNTILRNIIRRKK